METNIIDCFLNVLVGKSLFREENFGCGQVNNSSMLRAHDKFGHVLKLEQSLWFVRNCNYVGQFHVSIVQLINIYTLNQDIKDLISSIFKFLN